MLQASASGANFLLESSSQTNPNHTQVSCSKHNKYFAKGQTPFGEKQITAAQLFLITSVFKELGRNLLP